MPRGRVPPEAQFGSMQDVLADLEVSSSGGWWPWYKWIPPEGRVSLTPSSTAGPLPEPFSSRPSLPRPMPNKTRWSGPPTEHRWRSAIVAVGPSCCGHWQRRARSDLDPAADQGPLSPWRSADQSVGACVGRCDSARLPVWVLGVDTLRASSLGRSLRPLVRQHDRPWEAVASPHQAP